ncbi:MAG: hypothetical protein ACK4E7_03855 [Permianibacter sp.]
MKQVWLLFRHYLFWQPIMRPVFGLGVLMTLAGVIGFGYAGADPLTSLLVMLGSVLMWLFPVMAGSAGFRQLISNPRTALLPYLRLKAGLALFLLVIVASSAFALALGFTKYGWQWQVLVTCFVFASLFLQLSQWWLSQWWLSRRWGAALYWLLLVVISQVWQLPAIRSLWHDPLGLLFALVVAIIGWLLLLRWLRQARTIRRFTVGLMQQRDNRGNNEIHVPTNVLKWGFTGTRSATNTLLLGAYYNLKNRFGLQILMLTIMPLMIAVVLLVPALMKGKPVADLGLEPIVLLAMGLYGSLIGGFLSRESVARMRYLWLRCPGDRMALWQQLDLMLRGEWRVSVVASVFYAGMVWLLTAMPIQYGVWFVLLYGTSLFCLQYLTQYLRVRLTGNLVAGLTYSALMLVAGALIVTTLVTKAIWPVASLSVGFVLLGGVSRRGSQQHFRLVDWCQIKPVMLSRLTTPT